MRRHGDEARTNAVGVSSLTVLHGLEVLRQLGVDLSPVEAALGGPLSLDAPRCPWRTVVIALDALAPQLDALLEERFAARFATTHPLLKLATPLSLSPRGVLELVARAHATFGVLPGGTRYRFDDRHLVARTEVPADVAPCPAWWRLSIAVLGHVPSVVGHAPLCLVSSHIASDRVEARWTLPTERPRSHLSIPPATVLGALSQFAPVVAGLELARHHAPHAHGVDEAGRLQTTHGLTPTEARIALQLADGLNTRETARELGIS